MNFLDLAKSRYSVRAYQPTPVEEEKLEAILQAGRVAPTAANMQPNHFLVVNSEEGLKKLNSGTSAHGAPLAIVVCAEPHKAWVRPFDKHPMTEVDATIATDHMMLCAQDLGLSSCWLTYFDPKVIRQVFKIPPNLIPVNILVIGYSGDRKPQSSERHSNTRVELSKMITYGSF